MSFTQLNNGVGGDKIANLDNGDGTKTSTMALVLASSAPFTTLVSPTNPVPVTAVAIAGATYAPSWSENLAAGTGVVHAGACNMRSATFINRNSSIRYFQIWDNATTQSGTIVLQVPLDGSTSTTISSKAVGADILGPQGIAMANGIVFSFSTTNGSYSAGTAGDHDCFVAYK